MPIYEYQCTACAHKVEVMQRISDAPLKVCPSCSQEAMKKLVSAVGFQLKGTGWYETDFKGKKLLVIHGDQFDGIVRYARWLAILGDWAYNTALRVNTLFNSLLASGGGELDHTAVITVLEKLSGVEARTRQ